MVDKNKRAVSKPRRGALWGDVRISDSKFRIPNFGLDANLHFPSTISHQTSAIIHHPSDVLEHGKGLAELGKDVFVELHCNYPFFKRF